ncbi:MAG: acyltransferase [Ruminococcus sp.]|nr:acyltransferase [Ruminococcus sp.]MBQ9139963.1 acyltransferase [Ruminococcus sp.]
MSNEKKETAVKKNGFELLTKYRSAIMGMAALWILFFHEWQMTITEPGKAAEIESYIKRIGFCGVDIFLFLSGMGLVYAIGKSNILTFYYRRLKRVFLPFFIVGLIRFITEKWETTVFWKNIFCVNFYQTNMYSFLWFVPAILTFYLLFPLYYKIYEKASDKTLFTGAMFILWLGIALYCRNSLRADLWGFFNRIPVFLFGIHAGYLSKTKKDAFSKTTWLSLAVILAAGLYFAYLANFIGVGFIVPTSNCFLPNLLIAVSYPFVIAKLLDMLSSIPKINIIGNGIAKFFSFFGLFSLELYCVQEWLGGRILPKMANNSPFMKNFAVFSISIIAGFVLYLIVKYFWVLVELAVSKLKGANKVTNNTNS